MLNQQLDLETLKKMLSLDRYSDVYECLPFVSIDIETTGTDFEKHQILQVAAIFHNGKWNLDRSQMPYINFKLYYDPNKYSITGNAFALTMQKNYEMIKEAAGLKKTDVLMQSYHPTKKLKSVIERNEGWVLYEDAPKLIAEFLSNCKKENDDYYQHFNEKKQALTLCGKNLSSFDLPFLKTQLSPLDMERDGLNEILSRGIKHRYQDVGNMYYSLFGVVPSLDQVNKMNDRTTVSHDALDDAYDCVHHSLQSLRMMRTIKKLLLDNKII